MRRMWHGLRRLRKREQGLRCIERVAMRDMHLPTGGLVPPDYSEDEMSYPEKKKKKLAADKPKPPQKPRNTKCRECLRRKQLRSWLGRLAEGHDEALKGDFGFKVLTSSDKGSELR